MEKLELKHLATAFLNNQKVFYFDEERELNQICKIVELREEELTISNGEYQYDVLFDDIKLLSHPLSGLTKEIEHNGEKFVPVSRLFDLAFGSYYSEVKTKNLIGVISCENCIEKLTLNTEYMCFKTDAMTPDGKGDWNPPFNQLELFEKIHEWHFDIHGLIEKGLAIDINTLNK